MSNIFPIDFEEKNTIAQNDYILFSDSQDCNKLKKAQYSNLKWEKGDTWNAATVCVGSTTTGAPGSCACVTNSGDCHNAVLNFTVPQWPQGCKWDTGAAIVNAAFNWNDIDFTDSDGCVTVLCDAKTCLKWDKGDTGCTWATGPSICAAAFNGNNIDFTDTAGCVTTLCDAKTCLKGDTGATGCQWPSGTIAVGTTTTLAPWCSATVSNSGTCCAAIFNFWIPKWEKGDTGCTGPQWPGATVTIGTTTTLATGCCATVSNSGTCTDAVLNFGIPKWDKWDTWPTGCTWPAGNWIACINSTKAWKITTVDITCTDGCSYCFEISDWEDWRGAGDVLWPASSTNNHVVLFDGTTWKLIKDSGALLPPVYNSLSCSSTTAALSAKQWCVLNACYTCINQKIPTEASSSNKLADKNYVDNAINSVTAYYITKNAQGDQWATYAELAAATTFYSWGVARTPTRNDYTIVLADENYSNATTRYIYNSGWEYQYTVNETALTQSQLDALNSWITAAKVTCYDAIPVVTDNCQLCNGCWYTTCTGTLTAADLSGYATTASLCTVATSGKYCDLTGKPTIPTNNNQLTNGCGYTTCTGTISNCAGIISALWYTPYNCTNPAGYTTCTGTLTAETVVSGDSGCTYTIKVSASEPGAWTPATTITFVTA